MYRFQIPGIARGYTTHNRGGKPSKQIIAYWQYMEDARKAARFIAKMPLPLESPKAEPLMIFTRCYFRDGRHPDPENVHKGIKDALFYKAKDGDKHTGGHYLPPLYDKQNPRVDVFIRRKTADDEVLVWESTRSAPMSRTKQFRTLLGKLFRPGRNGVSKTDILRKLDALWDEMDEEERGGIWK